MKTERTAGGFGILVHESYLDGKPSRLVQESSVVGDYDDSLNKPGSSFLWVGEDHHLNREEVKELASVLRRWLRSGRLM